MNDALFLLIIFVLLFVVQLPVMLINKIRCKRISQAAYHDGYLHGKVEGYYEKQQEIHKTFNDIREEFGLPRIEPNDEVLHNDRTI